MDLHQLPHQYRRRENAGDCGAGSPADLCRPAVPELEGRLPGSADTGCGGLAATSGLLVAALVNLALHQLINHKEYRYIWLSIEILLLIAAFGSVDLLQVMFRATIRPSLKRAAATAALVGPGPWFPPCWPDRRPIVTTFGMTMMRRERPRRRSGPRYLRPRSPPNLLAIRLCSFARGQAAVHDRLRGSGHTIVAWTRFCRLQRAAELGNNPPPPAPWVKQGCSGQPLARERTCSFIYGPDGAGSTSRTVRTLSRRACSPKICRRLGFRQVLLSPNDGRG